MKFLIHITKDVIDRSLMCGTDKAKGQTINNCALAVAINELIPNVSVTGLFLRFCKTPFAGFAYLQNLELLQFVLEFDNMKDCPEQRHSLIGRELAVEIPDEVINHYYGDSVKAAQKIINNPILQTV